MKTKNADTVRIEFCSLDARDDCFTGYSPVAFANESGPAILGPKNSRLQMEMEREYLTRLRTLQVELRSKYLSRLDHNDMPLGMEESYDGFPSHEAYEASKAEVERLFPGKEADYRT